VNVDRDGEAASAKLFPSIVICCGCNLDRINPVPIRSTSPGSRNPPWYVTNWYQNWDFELFDLVR
jgi:hypothetical protein